jgi:hypothetical protein
MKSTLLIALAFGALAISSGVYAQSNAEIIEGALSAAPARAREATAVIKWNADYTYTTIKEGTNALVCFDRTGERDRQPFDVQCTSKMNLDRVAQNRRFHAESTDAAGERELVAAAGRDGTRVKAEFASPFITRRGPDAANARSHTTYAMPGATTASTGFPEDRSQGGAYIMAAGTTEAHLMTP